MNETRTRKTHWAHCWPSWHSTAPLVPPNKLGCVWQRTERVPCILWDRGCPECDAIAMSALELYLGPVPGHVHQDSIESSKHKNGSCSTMLPHTHTLSFLTIFFFECVRERGISGFVAHFVATERKNYKLVLLNQVVDTVGKKLEN